MPYSVEIDRKWQKRWEDSRLYSFHPEHRDRKLYVLEMFSYPSGAKLHVGHWYNYALTDSWARMKRMQGYEVFQPMGFDAFGLPAENYAIKTGIHPMDSTMANIKTMERQLREMGGMFDWDHEVVTCTPEYYRWTQWIFLQLYKGGLAYRKNAPVNWCPQCNTVLANEQVQDGTCERCHTEATKKNLTQWFFKITDYAQELLDCLETLDWPEKTKKIQTNWIGRSEGAEIDFGTQRDGKPILDEDGKPLSLRVFTTRADTVFGVTYVVVAPESELCGRLTTPENKAAVEAYRDAARKETDIERMSTVREKTGVFTGSYAVHPITGDVVPVWAADYVIAGYGTGVVMAVPAHDERDFAFATKFGLAVRRVIAAAHGEDDALPFCEYGVLVDSGEHDGQTSEEGIASIVAQLAAAGRGGSRINYRLRDWLVSRQRYWGAPIPMVHCEHCGVVPVPEDQLPVLLPYDVEFRPDGDSPLKKSAAFMNTTCPQCGGPALRDPDTLDTFVCSSWYQLRYPDNKNSERIFDRGIVDAMCPVDKYVGGAEHAAMHLLYARFVTKALRDLGYLSFDEPFKSLVHQGQILGPDGQRMSKSRGNTISPDEYISKYGSDVFRLYLAFGFAYTDGGPWSDDGVKATAKFVSRVEKAVEDVRADRKGGDRTPGPAEKDLLYALHFAIRSVTLDAERFQFNTSVARMMELVNALYAYRSSVSDPDTRLVRSVVEDLLSLLAPFAPHFTEEMWESLGNGYSLFDRAWPRVDPAALVRDTVEIAVQVNGAVRYRMDVRSAADEAEVRAAVEGDPRTAEALAGRSLVKFIFVKGRLANLVVR